MRSDYVYVAFIQHGEVTFNIKLSAIESYGIGTSGNKSKGMLVIYTTNRSYWSPEYDLVKAEKMLEELEELLGATRISIDDN